jgi:hypothetical protein
MVVYDDWFALALFTSSDFLSYRSLVRVDGAWMQRGGGGGGGGGLERRLTVGSGAGWSTRVMNPSAFASVDVHGAVGPEVMRVQVEFDDGHTEEAVVGDGVYAWFYARMPPPRRPPSSDHYARELLGVEPITVIGLGIDGRELARQSLSLPSKPG